MNLLLFDPGEEVSPCHYRITGERVEHIRLVLKRAVGESIRAGIVDGPKGEARITALSEHEAELAFTPSQLPTAPELNIDLLCAIPRPKILRRVLFAAGMMGIRRLMLIRANKTDKSYLQTELREPLSHRPYLVAGMTQGEWTRMPDVSFHDLFRPFVEDELDSRLGTRCVLRLLADPDADRSLLSLSPYQEAEIALAIGPESGWVPFEIDLLGSCGFQPVSLGPWNLRVDFAIAAAVAQLQGLSDFKK